MNQTVSIIVYPHNEVERLSSSLETIIKYFEKQKFNREVIVVDIHLPLVLRLKA